MTFVWQNRQYVNRKSVHCRDCGVDGRCHNAADFLAPCRLPLHGDGLLRPVRRPLACTSRQLLRPGSRAGAIWAAHRLRKFRLLLRCAANQAAALALSARSTRFAPRRTGGKSSNSRSWRALSAATLRRGVCRGNLPRKKSPVPTVRVAELIRSRSSVRTAVDRDPSLASDVFDLIVISMERITCCLN